MKLEEQDIVRFDNNSEYVIVKILNYNGNRYFYFKSLSNKEPNYLLMKETLNEGKPTFEKLEDEEFELVKDKLALNIIE